MNQVRIFDDVVRVDLMSEPNLVPPKNWIDNLPNLLHLSRCSQRPTPSTLPTALNGSAEAKLVNAYYHKSRYFSRIY